MSLMLLHFILYVLWSNSMVCIATINGTTVSIGKIDNGSAMIPVFSISPVQDRALSILARQAPNKKRNDCLTYKILYENFADVQRPPGCTRGFLKGSTCFFRCKKYFTLPQKYSNYRFSTCNTLGEWEPNIPKCVPVRACPGPVLPVGLHFVKDCSKSKGSACLVRCKKNLLHYGPKVIICQDSGLWTDIPNCGCPTPKIPAFAYFSSDCTPYVGKSCTFKCQNGYVIQGLKIIKCQKNGRWSKMPKCLKKCPPLQLSKGLKMVKKCSLKVGSICELSCGKRRMIGSSNVRCQSNGKWSPLPSCPPKGAKCCKASAKPPLKKKKVKSGRHKKCSKASIPKHIVFVPPSCKSSKKFKCKVGCRTPVFTPGAKKIKHIVVFHRTIKCSLKGEWKNFPNCANAKKQYWDQKMQKSKCPKPVAAKNVIIQKKCLRIEGTVCKISCKKGFISVGPNTIKCAKKKWSLFPKCKPISGMSARQKKCGKAKLPKHIIFADPACKASKKFKCLIACRTPLFIPGAKYIKFIGALVRTSNCTPKGKWTNFPNCTVAKKKYWYDRIEKSKCPKPIPTKNLIIHKKCSRIGGSVCKISCKEGYELVGPNSIKCSKKTWSPSPDCMRNSRSKRQDHAPEGNAFNSTNTQQRFTYISTTVWTSSAG